jgi:hypothetical protein
LLLVLVSLLLTILVLNDNNLALELLVSTVNESHSSTMIQLIVGVWESHALLLVPCSYRIPTIQGILAWKLYCKNATRMLHWGDSTHPEAAKAHLLLLVLFSL